MAKGEVEFKTYICTVSNQSSCYVIGECQGEVVAMGVIDNLDTDVYWVYRVSVHENFRRKGIGSAVMENILRIARAEGKNGVSLSVKKDNAAAIRMYEKMGFVKTCDYESGQTSRNEFMYTFII